MKCDRMTSFMEFMCQCLFENKHQNLMRPRCEITHVEIRHHFNGIHVDDDMYFGYLRVGQVFMCH